MGENILYTIDIFLGVCYSETMKNTTTQTKETEMVKVTITRTNGSQVSEWYASQEAALEARDRALDLGFDQVKVSGLPTTTWGTDGGDDEIIELS